MNKKLVAIAVVAALAPAAAMAETTVYGRIAASIDSVSGIAAEKNGLSVNDNSSRFGVKGSQAMDGGLTALYQIESGVSANGTAGNAFSGVRDSFIGLTGGFGTFLTGRLPAANQYVYDSNYFADQLGDAANFTGGSLANVGRANSALHYVSPGMGGVNVALTYLPAKSVSSSLGLGTTGGVWAPDNTGVNRFTPATTTSGRNSFGAKVNYAASGITASLTYFNVKYDTQVGTAVATETSVSPLSLSAGYDFGKGSVSVQYVKSKTTAAGTDVNTAKIINIGGKFNVTDSGAVKAQISRASESAANANDGATMYVVGYDHSLSKVTGVYVVYAKVSNNAKGTYSMNGWGHQNQLAAVAAGDNPSGFGVGLTHNF